MTLYMITAVYPKSDWFVRTFGGWDNTPLNVEKFNTVASVIPLKDIFGINATCAEEVINYVTQNSFVGVFETRELAEKYLEDNKSQLDFARKNYGYKYFINPVEVNKPR